MNFNFSLLKEKRYKIEMNENQGENNLNILGSFSPRENNIILNMVFIIYSLYMSSFLILKQDCIEMYYIIPNIVFYTTFIFLFILYSRGLINTIKRKVIFILYFQLYFIWSFLLIVYIHVKVINNCEEGNNQVLYIFTGVIYSNFILYFIIMYILRKMRFREYYEVN